MQSFNRRKSARIGLMVSCGEQLEGRRLLSGAGQLDPSFGVGGKVANTTLPAALAMTVLPNGKIVEAGASGGNFVVARFTKKGALDTHFGNGGVVVTDFGGTDVPAKVSIKGNGKIVVAGTSNGDFAVVRYLADGGLDSRFGNGGTVTASFGTPSTLTQLGILDDGGVELYGHGLGQADGNIYGQQEFVRLTKRGKTDSSFGTHGKLTIASTQPLTLSDAAILPDGEVFSGITLSVGHQAETELIRYNSDGSLGTTFQDPFGANDISFREQAGAVAVQSDGKVLFSRYHVYDSVLVRYNADGTPDATFGTGGVVVSPGDPATNNLPPILTSLYQSSDEKIVATDGVVVYRYNSDGSLDTGFGTGGQTIAPFAAGSQPLSIDAGLDNSIIVAGGLTTELDLAKFTG